MHWIYILWIVSFVIWVIFVILEVLCLFGVIH